MEPFEQELTSALSKRAVQDGPGHILIVAGDDLWDAHLFDLLLQREHTCRRVYTLNEARQLLAREQFDLLLIGAELIGGDAFALIDEAGNNPRFKTIVIDKSHTVQAASRAMRCGAVDFLTYPVRDDADFLDRVDLALQRSRIDQQREKRLVRLKQICKQLNIARRDISDQVDLLCHDLVNAYHDINDQLNDVAMASEFRTLLGQELDVEGLLRTALEYTLTKTGPTNAAVFLPDGEGMFNLGAYVNYDCPRATVDFVLDKLGEAVCPQLEREADIITFEDASVFSEWIGMDAGMLGESQVIAFACHHEEHCLAVVVLFRTHDQPFKDDLASTIETLRPIFASQLAKIISVHHRANPSWPAEADSDEMDFDDEFGYGCGGAAA